MKSDYEGVRILTGTGSHMLKHLLKFYKDMIGEPTNDVIRGQEFVWKCLEWV